MSKQFEPEIGQAIFSNGSAFEYGMQRHVESGLRHLGELVSKGKYGDDPTCNNGSRFSNDVFSLRSYCWCDGEGEGHEQGCPPNFVCGDFAASWYKHAGRGHSQSRPVSHDEWAKIMERCLSSLRKEAK